ncbi:MAG: type I-E CRISPR-associated protein Cas6/Cse3/CasE [Sphaerochaeta sp.]
MIATRIQISSVECKRHRLIDAYALHKFIYSLFPKLEDEARDFLYLDKGEREGLRQVLIFSHRWPLGLPYGVADSREIPKEIVNFDSYRFSVRLNPVIRSNAVAKPIRGSEAIQSWFLGKTSSWGFAVVSGTLSQSGISIQQVQKGNDIIMQQSVVFSGILEVENRTLFVNSFTDGIGRSKGFGFGLLEIVPIE